MADVAGFTHSHAAVGGKQGGGQTRMPRRCCRLACKLSGPITHIVRVRCDGHSGVVPVVSELLRTANNNQRASPLTPSLPPFASAVREHARGRLCTNKPINCVHALELELAGQHRLYALRHKQRTHTHAFRTCERRTNERIT